MLRALAVANYRSLMPGSLDKRLGETQLSLPDDVDTPACRWAAR